MEREERIKLSSEIEKKLEKGMRPEKSKELTEDMMRCGLAAFGLDSDCGRKTFERTAVELIKVNGDAGMKFTKKTVNSLPTLLWMYTADDDHDFDRGPSVDTDASEFLFTVLSRTAESLSSIGDTGSVGSAVKMTTFLTDILGSHWRESGELSWWNRFLYESSAAGTLQNRRSLYGINSVKSEAEKYIRVIESWPDTDMDEDRNCILGMICWFCYEAWHADDVKDERKERRYLRKTVRYLQNMDGNPFRNERMAEEVLEKALALLEA